MTSHSIYSRTRCPLGKCAAHSVACVPCRCHLVPSVEDPDKWILPEGARIHTEDELSTMIGPDAVCALESMRAGLASLDAAGALPRDSFQPPIPPGEGLVAEVLDCRANEAVPNIQMSICCLIFHNRKKVHSFSMVFFFIFFDNLNANACFQRLVLYYTFSFVKCFVTT